METRLASATKEIVIGYEHPTVLIGERINPAGKKKMSAAISSGNLDLVREEALAQVMAGADVIDVNVSVTGVDEAAVLPRAIEIVTQAVDVPVCIDTHNPEALKAALDVCRGKPLINSVSGEAHSLATVLPLVKEYGAAVIALVQDDEGVPAGATARIEVARKIVAQAAELGIPANDIVFDSLAMTVGAVPDSGLVALQTIRGIRESTGANQTLGASNISFGMPDRGLLNQAFLTMAITAGVTCPIVDAAKVRPIVLAADVLLNRDRGARRYIRGYRERQKPD